MNEEHSASTAPAHCLDGGVEPHVLTTEERRRGAERTNELRRERAKSFRQRLAEKLDERADEIITRLLDATEGDWRAITAALDQAFGKPTETVAVGSDGEGLRIVVESAFPAQDPAAVHGEPETS